MGAAGADAGVGRRPEPLTPGHGASWAGRMLGGLVAAVGLHRGSTGWPLTVSEAGPPVEVGTRQARRRAAGWRTGRRSGLELRASVRVVNRNSASRSGMNLRPGK